MGFRFSFVLDLGNRSVNWRTAAKQAFCFLAGDAMVETRFCSLFIVEQAIDSDFQSLLQAGILNGSILDQQQATGQA
ncbi:MAG TPA: hypothetical protein DIW77_15245 [Chromatiaceae bacterium]|nr:MAG: hypothetical protein N838_11780 [Thiohalocapsa sp. PB-PSB1]HCS91350.1 hypothetical protein [Chromatiaceae bacterium]